ncbi:MAG: pre-peptidase C-terminal domain-containing protein [Deltaproteobacteria bacterium]|nr:pre-peptidase C-terminal domain-containing protein [Deltaproteobacteria bacterium]
MKPRNKLFLFALIIFVLFGAIPTVLASEPTAEDFTNAFSATCADPAMSHFGVITSSSQVDYYAIDLVAGQFFTIDVDAEKIESPLDSMLEVFDTAGELVAVSVESSSEKDVSPDPYLEMNVDVGGTYYLAISAETPGAGSDTGSYTLLLTCSTQPPAPELTWPLGDGELIGSTGSTGSLVNITPETAESSLPFDLGVGPIADIEYHYGTDTLLLAIDDNPGNIIAIDRVTGAKVQTYNLAPETGTIPTVFALEATENMLYGVQVNPSSEESTLVQVTFDESDPINPKATLAPVFLFGKQQVRTLAYHSVEKVIYGVASIASKSDLIKIYLEPELLVDTTSAIPIVDETTGEPVNVVSLDFSNENFLIGIDLSGNLYEIDHTNGHAVSIGYPSTAVSGLTFVVREAAGVDPVGTICSSTFSTSASTSSGTADPKLSRSKLKKNPLHRAIGLFKFEGMQGETVTLNVELDGIESAEAVAAEESTESSKLKNLWLNYWNGKGRVFLGIRDAIPGVDYRKRTKDHVPFSMSATLPADGTYYVMVIRPLLRFYQTDYCLSLTSSLQEDSQAWKTFEVAWPDDESEDDISASTSAAESEDVQSALSGESEDGDLAPVTLSTTALEPSSAPPEEITVEETGDVPTAAVSTAENPEDPVDVVDESDSDGAPTDAGDTTMAEPAGGTPEEPAVGGDDTAVVQTVGDENPVVESGTETPVVGDSTVDETAVVTPEEPVVETPVVVVPAADEVSGTEPGDETVDDGSSDDPMEDPLPMKE